MYVWDNNNNVSSCGMFETILIFCHCSKFCLIFHIMRWWWYFNCLSSIVLFVCPPSGEYKFMYEITIKGIRFKEIRFKGIRSWIQPRSVGGAQGAGPPLLKSWPPLLLFEPHSIVWANRDLAPLLKNRAPPLFLFWQIKNILHLIEAKTTVKIGQNSKWLKKGRRG